MKKIKLLFLICAMPVLLSGCKQNVNTAISVKDLMSAMQSVENFKDGVIENISNQEVAERYGINTEDMEEGLVYSPKNEERSDKILLVKAKDKSAVENIERAVSSELIGLTDSWENNEKEFEKVEDNILKTKDVYVLLYVGENTEQIEAIFDNALSLE